MRDRLRVATDYLLVFAVFLVVGGDRTPAVNEPHYLTRLKHYWDPDWVRGDFFLDSPDAHLTVVLLFGWTTLLLPLPAVAWLGRLLSWALLAWAWRRLSWRVTPVWGVAPLTAAVWCVGILWGHFGGEWVVGGFEAKVPAWALVIAALGSYVRDEWNRVWCLLGAASAMHVLVGGWSVVLLGGVWLLRHRSTAPLHAMAPGLAIGGVLSLAGLAPPLVMNSGVSPEVAAEGARIYVFDRLPHHLAPLSMKVEWLLVRGSSHAAVLLALAAVSVWAHRSEDRGAVRRLCRFAWGAVLLAGCGMLIEASLAADPAAAAGLLRYYWFRMTDIAAPLAAALGFGAWLAGGLPEKKPWASVGLAALLLVAGSCFGALVPKRLDQPAPADLHMRDGSAWIDVCRWAAEETPDGTLFLTPRASNSFTWRTGRPELVVHKHIPQNAAGLVEWWGRLQEVYRRPGAASDAPNAWLGAPSELGAARLREIAERHGIDFVISYRRRPASLPVVYQNRTFVVYDVRPMPTEDSL